MENPLVSVIVLVVSAGMLIAVVLGTTRDEDCYQRDGEMRDGVYVAFDEPEYVCESRGDSYNGRSLRTGSSSRSSGSWFRK